MTEDSTRLQVLVAVAFACAACGPPCPGKCVEESPEIEEPDGPPRYFVQFSSTALTCRPYEGWETIVTDDGEEVSGIDVCAEFEDACWCETSERKDVGIAVVHGPDEAGCLVWELVEAGFWAYPSGTLCPGTSGWSLSLDAYPGSSCTLVHEPDLEAGLARLFEVSCLWTTDDGWTAVEDRLLMQVQPGTTAPGALNLTPGWTSQE